MAEDTGARGQIQALLADRDETFQDVKNTLKGLLTIPGTPLPPPPFSTKSTDHFSMPNVLSRRRVSLIHFRSL